MRELAEPLDGPSLAAFRRMAAGSVSASSRISAPRRASRRPAWRAGGAPVTPPTAPHDPRPTAIFDTTVVLAPDGELLTAYDKTHLFDRESAVFTPGAALEPPFVFGGVRFGVLCCFDIEFPEPARTLALRGAQCLLVPSANMEPWGEHHRAYVRSRALENHAFVAYANAVGAASGYVFEGGSCLVDPLGRVLCDAGQRARPWCGRTWTWRSRTRRAAVGDYLSERRPELYD